MLACCRRLGVRPWSGLGDGTLGCWLLGSFGPCSRGAVGLWVLRRQADLPGDGSYNYGSLSGAGVDVYVIDTGIAVGHSEVRAFATVRHRLYT